MLVLFLVVSSYSARSGCSNNLPDRDFEPRICVKHFPRGGFPGHQRLMSGVWPRPATSPAPVGSGAGPPRSGASGLRGRGSRAGAPRGPSPRRVPSGSIYPGTILGGFHAFEPQPRRCLCFFHCGYCVKAWEKQKATKGRSSFLF